MALMQGRTNDLLGGAPVSVPRLALRWRGLIAFAALGLLAACAAVWGLDQGAGPVALQATASGIPLEINHQGVVMVGGHRFDGLGDFRLALVDPDASTNRWTNDGTNVGGAGMPTAPVPINVDKGNYSVRLGDTSLPNMTAIPTTVFDYDNVVLRIWFDDGTHGVQLLTPDYVLTSAPYAYRAAYATEAIHALAADTATHASTADTAAEATHAATADALAKPELPRGAIIMWAGAISSIPQGWALCDGTNGTPDLTSRFVMGVPNASTNPGARGGSLTHAHGAGTYAGPGHTHTGTTGPADNPQWVDDNSGGDDRWCSGSGHQHSLTINAAGAGTITGASAEASTLPPYYVLAFILKI